MIVRSFVIAVTMALLSIYVPGSSAAASDDSEPQTVELSGAACADGTPMYVSITQRPAATKLYIYIQGGGACWDGLTCICGLDGHCAGGTAADLSRPDPSSIQSGWHDPNLPGNPITMDYNIAEIPYCTGDLFLGNRMQNFGSDDHPAIVQQFGYRNLGIALEAIKDRFPDPTSIVFMGSSAGGIAATFNVHQLRRLYPTAPLSVIADSGVPFKLPYIQKKGMERTLAIWGVEDQLPADYHRLVPGPLDLSGIVKYNAIRYPEHKYALISSYDDIVMNAFAVLVGTDYPLGAVRNIITDFAEHDIGPRQKVFFVPGAEHTFHEWPPALVVANWVNLGDWLSAMLEDKPAWITQR